MSDFQIIDTNSDNILELGICGYKSLQRAGFPEKVAWMKDRLREGLRIKTLVTQEDGNQGMIEYIPGEYCWRPVQARGYMFIHCLFVGFKRKYKNRGYATLLLEECRRDALKSKTSGLAAVTRKGSFMAGNEIFLKNDFEIVDQAAPDFELLVKKFDPGVQNPSFPKDLSQRAAAYPRGLTVIRAFQCPYTVKNVKEICEAAEKIFGIQPRVIDLKTHVEAQNTPNPFGTFTIICNGKIIAFHPISRTRFINIMKQIESS
jgi:hypothetical protein